MVSKIGKWFPYWVVERCIRKDKNPDSRMHLIRTALEPDECFIKEHYLEEQHEVDVWRVDCNTWICKTSKSELEKRKAELEREIDELEKQIGE